MLHSPNGPLRDWELEVGRNSGRHQSPEGTDVCLGADDVWGLAASKSWQLGQGCLWLSKSLRGTKKEKFLRWGWGCLCCPATQADLVEDRNTQRGKRGEGGRMGEERARESISFRNRSDLFKIDHSSHWEERRAQRPTPGLSNHGSLFLPVEQ